MDMAGFKNFLDNLDMLLDEGGPTMEELEIQLFGSCFRFTTVMWEN